MSGEDRFGQYDFETEAAAEAARVAARLTATLDGVPDSTPKGWPDHDETFPEPGQPPVSVRTLCHGDRGFVVTAFTTLQADADGVLRRRVRFCTDHPPHAHDAGVYSIQIAWIPADGGPVLDNHGVEEIRAVTPEQARGEVGL